MNILFQNYASTLDPYYRVCLQHKAHPASVFLQCLLGLWDQAVELALTFDAKLAQETAARSDPALQRKLWLRIAEHAISGTDNVKQALRLLDECDGLLKIEDVLPFFSDFERIDHFKDAICNALKVRRYFGYQFLRLFIKANTKTNPTAIQR